MTYYIATALAIVVLVIGSILLSRQQRDSTLPVRAAQTPEDPGYAARDAELIETGPDGRPTYVLHAELIRQRPREGRIDLEKVQMSVRDTQDNHWTLQADSGRIFQDTSRVELAGDVRVSGLLADQPDPAEIFTQRLAFDTQTEIVSTDAPVTLTWSGRELRGTGLVASLKEGRVRLESDVHGLFTP